MVDVVEGRGRADSVFLPCLFRLPAEIGRKKGEKKRVDLEEGGKKGEAWSRFRPQQMSIRGGSLVWTVIDQTSPQTRLG